MRASMIVVADPGADLRARVIEAEEQRFVQKLIAIPPSLAFDLQSVASETAYFCAPDRRPARPLPAPANANDLFFCEPLLLHSTVLR